MIKITLELLKDLRKATCVVFRVNDDNTFQLELSKKIRRNNIAEEWTTQHKFNDVSNWNALPECVFVSLYKDISGWDALAKLLKKDDELYIRIFTNNSELLTEKGLVNDQIHASIYRNGKQYLNDILLEDQINTPEWRAIKPRRK